ncbi:MAG: insulinase family protein [Fibromonadaceae bacterium]|jgi:predicted Zn-dependent peptidase|nr:insulinase family protein [Fibromonadaceae bacterium]
MRFSFTKKILFILLILGIWVQTTAQEIKVRKEVLENGLTVLLYENKQAPTVACRLFYATGSVHETPDNSGLAHLLEHQLFKGTEKLKPDELWSAYQEAGGTGLNAFTSDLMTAYFVNLPRNKVELFLWLEADRMQNAVIAREFEAERNVVMEERRMRYDDPPRGRYRETLRTMIYEAYPYRIPTIGWASSIENLTQEQAEEHYRKYYKPRNAILVFAGDFSADSLLPKIHLYFGNIPTGEPFPEIKLREPKQAGEKRLIVRRTDAIPSIDIIFKTPAVGDSAVYALDIVEGALNGRSGRLYKRLVEEEQLATSASASNNPNKAISTFTVSVALRPGANPEKAEAIVWEELEKLKNELVNEREFQKVLNNAYAAQLRSLTNMAGVATNLAWYEMFGSYNLYLNWATALETVSREAVKEAASNYFTRDNAVIGWLVK